MTDVNRSYWENMYEMPLEDIPWEIREAPSELKEYIEANPGNGTTALDAGCGTGNFSVYLAKNGYTVTGVDYSEKAIKLAQENNNWNDAPIKFLRLDLTQIASEFSNGSFDLILDYKVSHHLDSESISSYASQVEQILKTRGRLLLICYSDRDVDADGKQAAVGKFGNVMYYRSRDEIRKIFDGLHEVSYREVMLGKGLNHIGHCFVFEKQ